MCVLTADLQPFVDLLTSRSRLSNNEQDALLKLPTQLLHVDTHRDFVRADQSVDHVSVVVDGVVARFGLTGQGHRQITALHIAGDAPDLHSVVVPRNTFPLQALSKAAILRVPHAALRSVAARYPAIAEAFWRHCSVDMAIMAQWVVNVGRRDAKTRIAHLLCEMAVRNKAHLEGGEVTYFFPLTQTHLSDATGMTSVHVNRSLKALASEGLATVTDKQVRIPDWKALIDRGEFEATYLQADLKPAERMRIVDLGARHVQPAPRSFTPAK
jgi:CRP-like cAMP-binding protein